MAQAAWGGIDDNTVPVRYVFDEGHHVFDAADGAFAAEFSGIEAAELRRWLLGAEGGRSRARGLRRRLEELVAGRPALEAPLDAALQAARALPPPGWSARLHDEAPDLAGLEPGRPEPVRGISAASPAARFWRAPRAMPSPARAAATNAICSRPARVWPRRPKPSAAALARLAAPLRDARRAAGARGWTTRRRIWTRRCATASRRPAARSAAARWTALTAWQEMLRGVAADPPEPGTRPQQVMFLRLDRREGREVDVGLHRHWLDPTIPFALSLAQPAQGLLVTSATLRDAGAGDPEAEWAAAEARVGATHLPSPAIRVAVASPFDYAAQTRAFVVTDVDARDIAALAAAYRTLFLAAGGGGARPVHRHRPAARRARTHRPRAGSRPAFRCCAQHVDPMDNATLVDIFRTEEESCLLGTDAMRDGVDVPGRALRLVVFERVPWPRPDILHRERRVHLSGGDPAGYDDRIVRFRLRQAFGRLIRSGSDRGVFFLLDRQTPTRLLSAFPPGLVVQRVGLAQAVAETRGFLK